MLMQGTVIKACGSHTVKKINVGGDVKKKFQLGREKDESAKERK